ncbi:insulinase family protein [Candidatus Peregrinibacteria bacterium]|nr:insulinase family protein [Candidatus Peregrinibacteria bacterium]
MLFQFELKNGLKVAAFKVPYTKSINLNLVVKGGANFDAKGKMGTAHLLEHMLLQGTARFSSPAELTEFVESKAGYINALTYFETVEFVLRLPDKYLEDVLMLGAEVFFKPTFPEEAVEKERSIMLEEIYSNYNSTHDRVGRFFLEAKYSPESLLKNEVAGLPDDVKSLTLEEMKAFYNRVFKTDNSYLCLVGNFDEKALPVLVEKYFGGISTGEKLSSVKTFSEADLSGQSVSFRKDNDLSSAFVDLSFKALPKDASVRKWLAQLMAMNVFANFHKSWLYDLLRYQKGLVYSISMNTIALTGFGLNNLPFECSAENVLEVTELVVENLIKLKKQGISPEEHAYMQSNAVDGLMMQFDSVGAIMDTIKQDTVWEDRIYLPEETAEIIKSISVEEVNQVIAENWDFKKANLCLQMSRDMSVEESNKMSDLIERLRAN